MPPRALTGASWCASPTRTVLVPAAVVAVQELAEVVGPDHGGFVDDDQGLTAELQFVVAQ